MTRPAKRPIYAPRHSASEPLIDAETYLRENLRAAERIGTKLAQVTGWFLRFAQMNLDTLRDGDWMNLQYEVGALAEYQTRTSMPGLFWDQAFAWHDWQGRTRLASASDRMEPPTTLPPRPPT